MTKSSTRHRAEVIEIYDNGLKAAVKFYCNFKRGERIECVNHNGTAGNPNTMQSPFHIGQTGMVDFVRGIQGWNWVFIPSKNQK